MTTEPAHLPETTPPPTKLTARSPEDVLAAVDVVMGFQPHDSVVMLTFGGGETFHARINLPGDGAGPDDLDDAVEQLHEPARRHGVESVVFVFYSADEVAARRLERPLTERFVRSGVRVVEVLRADGQRWYAPGRPGVPPLGLPYDLSCHPFKVQAVVAGQVIHGSREELAALLDARRSGVRAVQRARKRALPLRPDEMGQVVLRALPRRRFSDDELASVLLGLLDLDARDAAWSDLDRSTAVHHVRLWTDAVQRAPADLVGAPAAVLGLAAWLAGQGALAWCAVDRCQEADPDNSLARLVSDLLADAVPPSTWDRCWLA